MENSINVAPQDHFEKFRSNEDFNKRLTFDYNVA